MNSGALRQFVTLDVPAGQSSYTPLNPAEWYCAVVGEGAATLLLGRYHPGITTATRVHLKNRVFHVDAIINREERDLELVLTVHEVFD